MYGNSHPNMSVYGIMILKCQNFTTSNNNSCYSEEIIDNELKKNFQGYSLDFLEHNILLEDYKNPNININHKIKNLYNLGVGYTTNHINLNPIILKTCDAYFFENEKLINSYKFHLNEKITTLFSEEENPNYNILAEFNFYMNNQEDIFIRSYKKIEDILGSITGTPKIILLISEGMNILIFNYSYLNDMNSDVNIHYKKQYLDRSISCYNN